MANNAFDAMNNAAGDDMYITGGAITFSEYEQNMSPEDQAKYETILSDRFLIAYNQDPYKGNLDFDHWLKTLNADLYRERAKKYTTIKGMNNGVDILMSAEPQQGQLLQAAGIIQDLAHLHTGRIEDIIEIVSNLDVEGMSPMQGQLPPRRPEEAPGPGY